MKGFAVFPLDNDLKKCELGDEIPEYIVLILQDEVVIVEMYCKAHFIEKYPERALEENIFN